MARKKVKARVFKSEPEPEPENPFLTQFHLDVGDQVRFRQRDGQDWTNGVVRGDYKDGSITIFDADGKMRAIMPDKIQVKFRGPRGGTTWKDLLGK